MFVNDPDVVAHLEDDPEVYATPNPLSAYLFNFKEDEEGSGLYVYRSGPIETHGWCSAQRRFVQTVFPAIEDMPEYAGRPLTL